MCVQISFSSDDITRRIKMPLWTLCVSPLRHVLQNNCRPLPLLPTSSRGWGGSRGGAFGPTGGGAAALRGVGTPPGLSEPQSSHLKNGLSEWLPVPSRLHRTDVNGTFDRSFVPFSLVVFIVNEFDLDMHK